MTVVFITQWAEYLMWSWGIDKFLNNHSIFYHECTICLYLVVVTVALILKFLITAHPGGRRVFIKKQLSFVLFL